MSGETEVRLREALEDLDRYLADLVAPLLVADSIEVLLDYAPELTAEALHAWAVGQFRVRDGDDSLADLLFHAIKKIQAFEEFNLLPQERFKDFLAGVAEHLVAAAPPGESERLAGMLAFLREGRSGTARSLDRLHRAPGARRPAPAREASSTASTPLTPEEMRSLRRFTMLFERLAPDAAERQSGSGPGDDEAARQLLVLAAAGATSARELESRMAQLHEVGVGPAVARDLVRSLSSAIPDWVVRRHGAVEVVSGDSVEAVRRAVRHAGDGARTAERWKDLLRSAAESFNDGAYARAVTLLDLADRMVEEKELDRHVADIARGTAHQAFEPTRLLQATADSEHRPILRRLVEFFPAWSVPELLDAITYQPDSKRRRLTLALLEVWGEKAYQPVVERLATAVAEGSSDPNVWWFLRNLVYLLHRLPKPDDLDPKQVLELAAPFSSLQHHPSFQREAITLLGQLPAGTGAAVLIQRLQEVERALTGAAPPPHEPRELEKILNSIAVALVRSGSPAARRALVEHGLGQRMRTGEESARLAELGSVDLSGDREVLGRLLEAARGLAPRKLLGFVVARNEEALVNVVRALASTADPAVHRMFRDLAKRFPDREYGRLAAAGISGESIAAASHGIGDEESEAFVPTPAAAPVRARASMSGDLEVFGLPGLLQNLQQSAASGRLTLRAESGLERATLELVEGRLGLCSCGLLEAEAAFYQIFERPVPGTFEFVRDPAEEVAAKPDGRDMMGLLMEAMRRFDEFQNLRALVPDDSRLRPGEARPTAPPGEEDGELMRRLWTALRDGATVGELDRASEVDSYRCRSLLAHWLDEGAAVFAAAAPSPPAPESAVDASSG